LLLEGTAVVVPGSVVGAVAFVGSSVGEGGEVTKGTTVGKIVVSSTVGDIVGIEVSNGDEEGSRLAASTVEVGGSVKGVLVAGVIGSVAGGEEIEGDLVGAKVGGISIGVVAGHSVSVRRKYAS
jgi:hypothetical protein